MLNDNDDNDYNYRHMTDNTNKNKTWRCNMLDIDSRVNDDDEALTLLSIADNVRKRPV